MSTEPSDDEVLVTKWLLLGGVIWDSCLHSEDPAGLAAKYRWFAIEPGGNEDAICANWNADTPANAIRRFMEEEKNSIGFRSWLAPLLEHVRSTTSSDRGPT